MSNAAAAPQQLPPLEGSARLWGTIALSAATFMNVLDTSIANVSLPAISGDLGVSSTQGTWVITSFAVGKRAPEVTGRDLEGKTFRLSDYRGRVVVLKFSAEWCGICHAQAPYERFLLDKYANWPFAILGVETGSSRDAARQAHLTSPVAHRVWWDAPIGAAADGPIASAWNVTGWPAAFRNG